MVENNETASLNIALVQLAGSSHVSNGENDGQFLQHTNIVIVTKTVKAGTIRNKIAFALPLTKDFTSEDHKVIAFFQNKNGEVVAAAETDIR